MIDEYEYKVGKLEKFVEILDNREKLIGNSRQTHEEKKFQLNDLKYKKFILKSQGIKNDSYRKQSFQKLLIEKKTKNFE